jgi:hypothetical protein
VGRTRLVFTGHIAGFGTTAGVRIVVGSWQESPFGRFADIMLETAEGRRILLAPSPQVAEFVSETYTFDQVEIGPVVVDREADRFSVDAPQLAVTAELGGPAPFDWLLRLVPAPLSRAPWWLRGINPVATRLVPGVRTAGSAGRDRREYYGVRRTRRITAVQGTFGAIDLGAVADIDPPVRFGFSSAPPTPQLVSVTTTITAP